MEELEINLKMNQYSKNIWVGWNRWRWWSRYLWKCLCCRSFLNNWNLIIISNIIFIILNHIFTLNITKCSLIGIFVKHRCCNFGFFTIFLIFLEKYTATVTAALAFRFPPRFGKSPASVIFFNTIGSSWTPETNNLW